MKRRRPPPPLAKTEQPDEHLLEMLEADPPVHVEIVDGRIVATPIPAGREKS